MEGHRCQAAKGAGGPGLEELSEPWKGKTEESGRIPRVGGVGGWGVLGLGENDTLMHCLQDFLFEGKCQEVKKMLGGEAGRECTGGMVKLDPDMLEFCPSITELDGGSRHGT